MKVVKKSFNISSDLAQRIDDFVRDNPGVSFTWLVNQALAQWLKNPQVTLNTSKAMTEDEMKKFMDDNKALMEDLSK